MSETAAPKVTVVVLNWNTVEHTLECLDSLRVVKYPNMAVLVIENGSTENPARVIRHRHPWIHLARSERNLGFTGGNNWGMRIALEQGAEYILLLNNDTTIASDAIMQMVQACRSRSKVGVAGPKIMYHNQPNRIQSAGCVIRDGQAFRLKLRDARVELRGLGELDEGQFDETTDVDTVSGCAMFIPREVVERIGFLEERLFVYWEDVEYSLRARQAGLRCLYVPTATVWHKGSMSTGHEFWSTGELNPFQLYLGTRNRHLVIKRYWGWRRFLYQWVLLTLRTGLSYLKRPQTLARATPWLWGSIDGLVGRAPHRFFS